MTGSLFLFSSVIGFAAGTVFGLATLARARRS